MPARVHRHFAPAPGRKGARTCGGTHRIRCAVRFTAHTLNSLSSARPVHMVGKQPMNKPFLLVVEDDDLQYEVYEDMLSKEYELQRVTTGRQALESIAHRQ